MTGDAPKPRALVMPIKKRILTSVTEAKTALGLDRLGCVYRRSREVYVVTAFGSGVFGTAQWDADGERGRDA